MIGTRITTEAGLADLWQHAKTAGSAPAVVDSRGTVWTLVKEASGDRWAFSFRGPDLDQISSLRWRSLLGENPAGLIVVWRGGNPADAAQRTVPYADAYAVLEAIREHGRGAVTAPVHHAFVTAGILLEQLLGEPASAPPYTLIGADRG